VASVEKITLVKIVQSLFSTLDALEDDHLRLKHNGPHNYE
jgi:hypothetical protein